MTEKLLHHAQIGAALDQMSGEDVQVSMVPTFARQGVELVRLSDELPTDQVRTEITGPNGEPLRASSLSDEELTARAAELLHKMKNVLKKADEIEETR